MHEGAKVQFSSQTAAEQFCFPAEMRKLSLKLTGNWNWCSMKTGGIQGHESVLPHCACSQFDSELGKLYAKHKTQPQLGKKVKDQSQLLDLLLSVLPWVCFPSVKGPALGLEGAASSGDKSLNPLQEAGASPHSCFSGWQVATEPQQSHSTPVPLPGCPILLTECPHCWWSMAGFAHPEHTLCPTLLPPVVTQLLVPYKQQW